MASSKSSSADLWLGALSTIPEGKGRETACQLYCAGQKFKMEHSFPWQSPCHSTLCIIPMVCSFPRSGPGVVMWHRNIYPPITYLISADSTVLLLPECILLFHHFPIFSLLICIKMAINKSTDFSKIKQPDWVRQGIFWSKMYSLRQEQNMTAHQSFISLSRFIQNPTLQIPASPLSSQITRTGTNKRLQRCPSHPPRRRKAKVQLFQYMLC